MEYNDHIKNLLLKDINALTRANKHKASVALLDILEQELTNFDYSKDISYIFPMFDILAKFLCNDEPMQNNLYNKFLYIHNLQKNLLHARKKDMNKEELKKYKTLKNMINKYENTMLQIYYNIPEYDLSDKEAFIYYIVFKIKNINDFSEVCKKYPYIINCVNKDNKPLIEVVIMEYLNALNNYLKYENLGPIDDLIYYEKVVDIILKSEKVKIDTYTKNLLIQIIDDFYNNQNYSLNRHKEKLSFFINNIKAKLLKNEEIDSIEYLSYKYEIHDDFKQAHKLEAKTIEQKHILMPNTTTEKKIYTFDGEDALEIDDGLSIELIDGIYHLGVHIANPTAYINKDSILIDEAIRRTTSIYLPEKCIPLYPLEISGNTMSLNESKNTYCTSYYFDIDAISGELLKFEIKKEICRIAKNMTYSEFNDILIHGHEDEELLNTLINLSIVNNFLKRIYNEDLIYKDLHNDKNSTLSHLVVENAMIYTNYNVAKRFNELELPFIYRCHQIDEKDRKELVSLQERLRWGVNTGQMVSELERIKNRYPRAQYMLKNKGHFGLGIDYYSHSTSPLRRIADNIVNMCIDKFILGTYTSEDIKYYEEYIEKVSEQINSKRNSIEDYEKQCILRHKKN